MNECGLKYVVPLASSKYELGGTSLMSYTYLLLLVSRTIWIRPLANEESSWSRVRASRLYEWTKDGSLMRRSFSPIQRRCPADT